MAFGCEVCWPTADARSVSARETGRHTAPICRAQTLRKSLGARPDLGQRPLLPGHAIAGWGFKTSIVMLPVVMLKARATNRISFAIRESPLLGLCRKGMRAINPERMRA